MRNIMVCFCLVMVIGCGEQEDEITPFNGIAAAITGDPEMPVIAVHEDGSYISVIAEEEQVAGAVYVSEDNESFTVWLDDSGMPIRAYASGYTFVFGNYSGNAVDIAVIDSDGETEIHSAVPIEMQTQQLAPLESSGEDSILYEFLKVAGTGLSLAGCAIAVATGAGIPAAILPCGAVLLKVIELAIPGDTPALEASSTAVGAFASGLGCVGGQVTGCIGLLVDASTVFVSSAEYGMKQVGDAIEKVEQDLGVEVNIDAEDQIIGQDGVPMVLIPAGEFQMGSADGEDDEKPVHTVYLDAFYIDVYEVTYERYKKFLDESGYSLVGEDNWSNYNSPEKLNYPVRLLTWRDANAYCEWAGKRLPTEAEWEKAARGGLVGKKYPWGDEAPDEDKGYFHFSNSKIGPVGSFDPNGYGLYDMAGNVYEWCNDWYDKDYYKNSPNRNPRGPTSQVRGTTGFDNKVLRGGYVGLGNVVGIEYSIADRQGFCLSSCMSSGNGFRCVQDVNHP